MLPKVEKPIPETIGLGTIIALGAAMGMASLAVAVMLRLPDAQRDAWSRIGVAAGFVLGLAVLSHDAGCSTIMQTMNRRSTRTIVISSGIVGVLSVVLAIVTDTGTIGTYAFALSAMPILLTFLMWPERTRFFLGRSQSGRADRRHGRTRRRRDRPRAL